LTTRRRRIAYWIPKATNTHPVYVIPIAFPQRRWLHERDSMIRHTYIACLAIVVSVTIIRSLWLFLKFWLLLCSANGTGFSRSTLVASCQYRSPTAPQSYFFRPPMQSYTRVLISP
jgi:hypothetical protein